MTIAFPLKREQGYFLFLAVFFILVIGVMGSLIAYLSANRTILSVSQQNGLQVFYNAESGLEIATHYLSRPSLSTSPIRIACASVTGASQLTNASLNGGTFTATTINNSPVFSSGTLSGALTASATTINLVDTSGFSPNGRVMVDREAIDYAAILGNSLVGASRGAGGTLASRHISGASVGQYQCSLDVQSGIPNLTSPSYKRELQWNVQLQDSWTVGNVSGSNFVLSHWNQPTELNWSALTVAGGSSATNLNAVSMLSNADGWAVGDRVAAGFIFLHWNGAAWTLNMLSGACSGQHLLGISMVSSAQGFAVGARYRPACAGSGNYRYTILYWNGSAWSLLTPSTSIHIPADASALQNLNAVHVVDTDGDGLANIGFAVGDNGTILQYNGGNWVVNSSPTTQNLMGVYTVSSSEAWATGAGGVLLKWNGNMWSTVSSPTTTALNAIAMLDTDHNGTADFGIAVGNSSKIAVYNGSTWSISDEGSANLFGVDLYNAQDAWAVGASGTALHWDGATWTSMDSGTTKPLNGISLISPGQPAISIWRQIFH